MYGLGKSLAAQAPTIPLLQEEGSNTQLLIQNNSFKGKSATIWGLDLMVWEATEKYGIDYYLLRDCLNEECNFSKKHETCLGDRGLAFGRCQFHKPTWKANCVGDYRTATERDQIFCMAKMWSEGKQNEWSCYKKIMRTLGDRI